MTPRELSRSYNASNSVSPHPDTRRPRMSKRLTQASQGRATHPPREEANLSHWQEISSHLEIRQFSAVHTTISCISTMYRSPPSTMTGQECPHPLDSRSRRPTAVYSYFNSIASKPPFKYPLLLYDRGFQQTQSRLAKKRGSQRSLVAEREIQAPTWEGGTR